MKRTSRATPYAPTKYFENFSSVAEYLFDTYYAASELLSFNGPQETIRNISDALQNIQFISRQLGIIVHVRPSAPSYHGEEMSADVSQGLDKDNNVLYKHFSLSISVYNIVDDRFKSKDYFYSLLAHELQHIIEYYFQKDAREESGNKKWYKNISPKVQDTGRKEFLDFAKYYNSPHEVRARLAELLQYYNVTTNKEKIKQYIASRISQGETNSKIYHSLINNFLSARDNGTIDQWGLKYIDFLSPVSYKYLIKGFYDAINN